MNREACCDIRDDGNNFFEGENLICVKKLKVIQK